MGKDWKYIVYVSGAVMLFVIVKLLSPKQFDWSVSLAHEDKDPYGTFVLYQMLPDIFKEKPVSHSYQTLYELKDSLKSNENIVIFTTTFNCGKEDTRALLTHVANGGNAFISAHYFWGHFSDSLNVSTYDYFFTKGDIMQSKDSSYLKFVNQQLDTTKEFWFRRDNIHNYFERFDTARTTVIAKNNFQQPVTIRVSWGKGNLILNCTPLAFTNIYLLSSGNDSFVSGTLSYLPPANVHWTEFYHLGRMESGSPLRFILTHEPLAWAYYITIGSILLFMIFEAKRKQRVIPVVKAPSNTTLEFVSTIGNLYYQNNDHKNIAEKKINFLLDQIRTKYFIRTTHFDDEFIATLANKSGNNKEDVESLFRTITYILSSTLISAGQLVDLNQKIEKFNAAQVAGK
jgi:hypothetical protein